MCSLCIFLASTSSFPNLENTKNNKKEKNHHICLCIYVYICTCPTPVFLGFPGGSDSKESICNAGDLGSILGSGRSSGEGNGNPLQCSCLENSMNSVCGRKKSDTTEQLTHTSLDTFETMFEFLSLELPCNFILIFTLFQRGEFHSCSESCH